MASASVQDESPQEVSGVLAEFANPDALVAAAAKVREAGYTEFDAHSPFPVHGIDPAMGIRRTRLPFMVLGAGITGAVVALVMQWWTNAVDYPIIISGKPFFGLPANIPVTFELIVLLSAFAAFFGVFALSRLPLFNPAVSSNERFRKATTTGFFISVDARDPKFNEQALGDLFREAGAEAVETYGWAESEPRKIPIAFFWIGGLAALLAVLPPLFVAKAKLTRSDKPRFHPIHDMDHQPRYEPQAASSFFADGRTMRKPVPGTVARIELEDDEEFNEDEHFLLGTVDEQQVTVFPPEFEISKYHMQRGQERFNIFCAPCHGYAGSGDGLVSQRGLERQQWAPIISLIEVRDRSVGSIYTTITNGINKMPSYAAQIPPEDRWAIVLYVRALQRSQNATFDDVPEEMKARLQAKLQ